MSKKIDQNKKAHYWHNAGSGLFALEWIDVKDRLPDHPAIDVLICTASGLVTSTFYCLDKNFFNPLCGETLLGETDDVSAHFRHAREYGYKVTHWMPLPPLPSE